ncbi:hypothetical protein FB451DRAFT_1566593 [Mycena latifolia]|nr:hypothetical protein FB451DRAFT_1566593 [Mycena latifolia]
MTIASRDWCAIPDTYLPVPWSCDWSNLDGWSWGPEPLQDDLRRRYDIPGCLNPIMFHDSFMPEWLTPPSTRFKGFPTTLFESRGILYLASVTPWEAVASIHSRTVFYLLELGQAWWDDNAPDHFMYRFSGLYSSVEDFLENCDWNQMQRMEGATSTSDRVQYRSP